MPRRPPTPPPSPRGKGLFGEAPAEPKPAAAAHRANIDGGSRGNPGPASYGVVIRDGRGEIAAKLKKYIGRTTNNVAEYYGLIAALDYAESHGVRALRIESDSELLVKQMRGLYKVKSEDLRPLFERAQKMSKAFEPFRIEHVYREQNREADALANEALDEAEGKNPGSPAAKKTEPSGLKAASPNSKPILPNAKPEPASSKPEPAGSKPEPRKIQARFRGGVLYLLEDVELPDGMVVDVSIHLRPKPVV
jgi:ribonuclease HI